MTGSGNAQVFQFALTASEASGNLPKGMSSTQLAEEHGHELSPAGEASSMTFGPGSVHGLEKLSFREKLQQLAKHATKPIHKWPSFKCEIGLADSIYHKSKAGPIFLKT